MTINPQGTYFGAQFNFFWAALSIPVRHPTLHADTPLELLSAVRNRPWSYTRSYREYDVIRVAQNE